MSNQRRPSLGHRAASESERARSAKERLARRSRKDPIQFSHVSARMWPDRIHLDIGRWSGTERGVFAPAWPQTNDDWRAEMGGWPSHLGRPPDHGRRPVERIELARPRRSRQRDELEGQNERNERNEPSEQVSGWQGGAGETRRARAGRSSGGLQRFAAGLPLVCSVRPQTGAGGHTHTIRQK